MPANEIKITGEVWDWDIGPTDERQIQASEINEFEERGYIVFQVQGHNIAVKDLVPADGDLTIQPKSDMFGRIASAGGHSNFGYSGYFKAYVFVGGKRRRLVDFWTLFPDEGHHYASQTAKNGVSDAIKAKIASMSSARVYKVKGGFAFEPALVADSA